MITPEGSNQPLPAMDARKPRKFDMELLVGYILLVGVLLSVALIISGVAWQWLSTGQLGLKYSISGANFYHFIVSVITQAFQGKIEPPLVINLGIVTLMLTPYMRVFASMVYFAFAQRNWKYTFFTAVVFAILTYSLIFR